MLFVNVLYLSKGTRVIVVCTYMWEGRREFISGWVSSTREEEKGSLWVEIGFDLAFDPHVAGRVKHLSFDLPLSFDIHVCREGQTL